jgi:amidohydrolase
MEVGPQHDAVDSGVPLVAGSEYGDPSKPRHGASLSQLISLRRDLHCYPELKFEERRTARKIVAFLEALGIPLRREIAQTGVVGAIYGAGRGPANAGPSIGLRADMDALPIHEVNTFGHASLTSGKMHACGHDGHVAMLLGAAESLARRRDFDGTVYVIFQPGEEGGAGAQRMIDAGLFEEFPCDAVFALHNWPDLPLGKMGTRAGPIMASAKRFEIKVLGRGGHAAQPHLTIDPIPVACAIVGQMQTLVSRRVNPLGSAVLTVGKIEGGTSFNVIPGSATIHGTCRTLGAEIADEMCRGIERVAGHVAAAHEASAEVTFHDGYPGTDNDHEAAQFMGEVMQRVVGEPNAVLDVPPAMTAEDFSFMLQRVPGAYGFIGNGPKGGAGVPLHSAHYDFNDGCISIGVRFWDALARDWFSRRAAD